MDNRDISTDSKIERAKDNALGKHDSNPSHVDEAGEAVGGIGGVLAGAAIGSAIGPISGRPSRPCTTHSGCGR